MSSIGLIVSTKEVNYVLRKSYKHMIKNAFTPFIDTMSSKNNLSDEKLVYAIWYM